MVAKHVGVGSLSE